MQQSGLQTMVGSGSVSPELEQMSGNDSSEENAFGEDGPGAAWLVICAFLAVIAGVILTVKGDVKLASYAGVAAAACILLQVGVGFPMETEIKKTMAESMAETTSKTEADADNPFSEMGNQMATAMSSMIQVEVKPVVYITALFCLIPFASGYIKNQPTGALQASSPLTSPNPGSTPTPERPEQSYSPQQQDASTTEPRV